VGVNTKITPDKRARYMISEIEREEKERKREKD